MDDKTSLLYPSLKPKDLRNSFSPMLGHGLVPENHGLFSTVFFTWILPILWRKGLEDLTLEEVPQVIASNTADRLEHKLSQAWQSQLNNASPSLSQALIRVFIARFTYSTTLGILKDCVFRVAQGPVLAILLLYFDGDVSEKTGIGAAAMLFILTSLYTVLQHHTSFLWLEMGMKCRIATTALIYRKVLRLSQYSLAKSNVGQMTNFLSNDVNRFDRSVQFLPYLIIAPLQALTVTGVLWYYLGPVCLTLTILILMLVPLQGCFGKLIGKYRGHAASRTDFRVRLINEIVNGIEFIKMSTWERPYAYLVSGTRKEEIKYIRKKWIVDALNKSIFDVSSKLVIALVLFAYMLAGNVISAIPVFVTVTLCNYLRTTVTNFLPMAITGIYELAISIRRIQTFLLLEERDCPSSEKGVLEPRKYVRYQGAYQPRVNISSMSTGWSEDGEDCLSDISLQVIPGSLLTVIGTVGSGKSSLFNALLGELPPRKGHVEVVGSVAYASQDPWLYGGTVRENILFGRPFEPLWYAKVIEACALRRDFTLLPFGDKTTVGEKGMVMSGGQKARINLARAVYANADIYLLDDPLSAVDTKVGRHLFEKCILGILQSKIVILATHQLQYCEQASEILVLRQGHVAARGVYEDLKHGDWDLPNENTLNFDLDRLDEVSAKRENLDSSSNKPDSTDNGTGKMSEGYGTFVAGVDSAKNDVSEIRSEGYLSLGLHWMYIRSGNGWLSFLIATFLFTTSQIVLSGSDYWLKIWTDTATSPPDFAFDNTNFTSNSTSQDAMGQTVFYVEFYGVLIAIFFFFSLARNEFLVKLCMSSSTVLHDSIFNSILRAPMRFFEVNSVGRVLNRLVNDVGTIDEDLPRLYQSTLNNMFQIVGLLVVVCVVQPVLILPAIFTIFLFIVVRNFYLRTGSGIKRIEAIARSPVFAHLSTTVNGLTTIRAFRAELSLEHQFFSFQNQHTATYYLYLASYRWFAMVLDWISNLYFVIVLISYMITSGDSSSVGLAVSSALNLTLICSFSVAISAELDNQVVAVERVVEYSKIEPEGPLEIPGRKAGPSWAKRGKIQLDNVTVRYGDGPPVLNQVSLLIKPKEKIGLVGRTGAGKSTIVSTIFRLVEPASGTLRIDELDLGCLGLHDVRGRVTIIPQMPILLIGTVRRNLDVFDNHSDEELWRALADVNLADRIGSMSAAGLETPVSQGGSNFSSGERQLLCLARAILSGNKIVILDEPTANVDPKTDEMMQKIILEKFSDCTILTVAHRLDSVIGSDKICVMDNGHVVEFGAPHMLLQNRNGALYQLAEQTGPTGFVHLVNMASEAHLARELGEISN